MVEQTEALCDLWEGISAVLPLHSRLYHLEPIGVGSPMVESLTGYVKRLAEAHCVSVRALIRGEILPLCQRSAAYRNEQVDGGYITGYLRSSLTLNGPNILARDMVQALERLTLFQNLRFLTMLPWCGVLSTNKLLRRMQAWCPTCYGEWRERGQIVYEPLLWALNDVKVCPRHHVQLQTQCRCGQAQPPLASRSLPGCCSRCGRWLGGIQQSRAEGLDIFEDKELEQRLWVANAVGELLSNAPSLLELPNRDLLPSIIKDYAEKLTGGSIKKLTNQIRLRAIPDWIYAKETPQLGSLLQFCFALGASPFRLLTGEVEESAAANALKDTPMKQSRKFDARKLQLALEAVLLISEDPPLSMAEVARRLEYAPEQLRLYFPELCRAISARYKASPVFFYGIAQKQLLIQKQRVN